MADVGPGAVIVLALLAALVLALLLRGPIREYRARRRERERERKRAWRRQRDDEKARRRTERAMNPVRAAARKGEPTWQQVAKRQGRKCWLCGTSVQPDDATRSPDGTLLPGACYPAVDHVVPLDKGGTNVMDNVRLVHRVCRQRRVANVGRGEFTPPKRTYAR